MLMEIEIEMLLVARRTMAMCGVDVDDVDAVGAMRQKAQKSFDIIFIDFVMTTMSGPEAVQIIRRDMNFTGGIIGVTGNALPADLTYFKECPGHHQAINKQEAYGRCPLSHEQQEAECSGNAFSLVVFSNRGK